MLRTLRAFLRRPFREGPSCPKAPDSIGVPLAKESLDSIRSNATLSALTDQRLLDQVVGSGGTADGFLYGGFMTTVGIRAVLRHLDQPVSTFKRVLDFGCGPARLACWFGDLAQTTEIIGSDINKEAVAWANQNVGFDATFICNEPLPPLPLDDGSVDFVLALSVFTHLDEEYQFKWLDELVRVTKPNGLVLVTIHGEEKARNDLPSDALGEYLESGFLYMKAEDSRSVAGLPDFYQVAYHSHRYIARRWGNYLTPVCAVKHGPFWVQDAVVLRKEEKKRRFVISAQPYPVMRLPIASIDDPKPGGLETGNTLTLSGWAFYPDKPDEVELVPWIDGCRAEATITRHQRQDVFDWLILKLPQARDSGFTMVLPIEGAAPGLHTLYLTARGTHVPISATYFSVPER